MTDPGRDHALALGSLASWVDWLLRMAFHLLYNQLAPVYDIVAWSVSRGEWRTWGRTAMAHLQGPRVLELGHGPGHLLGTMLGAGLAATGLDRSPAMGRQARRRLLDRGLVVPLARGAAQQLPFAARTFQSVVATFPSETIVHAGTLGEVHRVLDRDGVFVVVPMAQLTGNGPIDRGLELAYQITGQRKAGTEQIEQRLRAAGFEAAVNWHELLDSQVMTVIARPIGR